MLSRFVWPSVCLSAHPSVNHVIRPSHPSAFLCLYLACLPRICLLVYPSKCPLAFLSVCLSVCLSADHFIRLPHLSAYLSVCLSAGLSVCLQVCLSVCLPVCLCLCLPVCVCLCLSAWYFSVYLSVCFYIVISPVSATTSKTFRFTTTARLCKEPGVVFSYLILWLLLLLSNGNGVVFPLLCPWQRNYLH